MKRGAWRCKDVGLTKLARGYGDAARERLRRTACKFYRKIGVSGDAKYAVGSPGRRKKDRLEASQFIEFKKSINLLYSYRYLGLVTNSNLIRGLAP